MQMAISINKEPHQMVYNFIFDILSKDNIPPDNIVTIVQSILLINPYKNTLFGVNPYANTFDNIFNR